MRRLYQVESGVATICMVHIKLGVILGAICLLFNAAAFYKPKNDPMTSQRNSNLKVGFLNIPERK